MKKFKSLGIKVLTVILSFAFIIAGTGLSAFVAAAEDTTPSSYSAAFFSGHIDTEVELNGTFIVPGENGATLKVTAPNGQDITSEKYQPMATTSLLPNSLETML